MKFKWEALQLVLNNLMNRTGWAPITQTATPMKRGDRLDMRLDRTAESPCRNKGYSSVGRLFGLTWHTWSIGHTLLGPPMEEQC